MTISIAAVFLIPCLSRKIAEDAEINLARQTAAPPGRQRDIVSSVKSEQKMLDDEESEKILPIKEDETDITV